MRKYSKSIAALALSAAMILSFTGCGGSKKVELNDGTFQEVDTAELAFPLKEKTTLTGMISYPANTESDPNKRTIFQRLQEKTNVEINWTAIQAISGVTKSL